MTWSAGFAYSTFRRWSAQKASARHGSTMEPCVLCMMQAVTTTAILKPKVHAQAVDQDSMELRGSQAAEGTRRRRRLDQGSRWHWMETLPCLIKHLREQQLPRICSSLSFLPLETLDCEIMTQSLPAVITNQQHRTAGQLRSRQANACWVLPGGT